MLSSAWPYAIGALGTVIAACVGAAIAIFTTTKNAESAHRVQEAAFAREARAVRLSTISALRDLVQYAGAAALMAQFNLELWAPSVETLVLRVTDPQTVHGFSDDEWPLVADAASEARLALVRLRGFSANPFLHRLDRTNGEVDTEQLVYVAKIRALGNALHQRVFDALVIVRAPVLALPEKQPITEIVDIFRAPLGQLPMSITGRSSGLPYKHGNLSDPGPASHS